MASGQYYLDDIKFWVRNEGRTVTYRWISAELRVPCDTAKKMLFHYVQDQGARAVYLVSGVKDGKRQVLLTPGERLDKCREEFSEIATVHVYAVLPGEADAVQEDAKVDSAQLWGVDYQQARRLQAARDDAGMAFLGNAFAQVRCGAIEMSDGCVLRDATDNAAAAREDAARKAEALPEISKMKAKVSASSFFGNASALGPNKRKKGAKDDDAPAKAKGMTVEGSGKEKRPTSKGEAKKKGFRGPQGRPGAATSTKAVASFAGDADEDEEDMAPDGEAAAPNGVGAMDLEEAPPSTGDTLPDEGEPEDVAEEAGKKKRKRGPKAAPKVAMPGAMDDFVSPVPLAEAERENIGPADAAPRKKTVKKLVVRTFQDEDGYLVTSNEWVEEEVDEEPEPVKPRPTAQPPKRSAARDGQGKARAGKASGKAQKSLASFFGKR